MKVVKTLTKKDDRVYTNYYLVTENGVRIPIQVKLIKKDNKTLNKYDIVKLDTLSEYVSK